GRGPLERLTKHTISSMSQLRRELAKVRDQGFALDREECEEGACCIAVPIFNAQGDVDAALGISAPTTRLTPRRMEELIPMMLRTGREVSAQLGFSGPAR
ncbi:MAG: IclR family transcriptional regulator C-terminal domain-containing protein, partial [candidate division NC10 bacterium]